MAFLFLLDSSEGRPIYDKDDCSWIIPDNRPTYVVCVGQNGMPNDVTDWFVQNGHKEGDTVFVEIV